MIKDIESFFEIGSKWKDEYSLLRKLVLAAGLREELKWGKPCYTFRGDNVVLIHGFKDYCALLFHKGALLDDPKNILIRQTKNVQSARQIRFRSMVEIKASEKTIMSYIYEAIEAERAGLEVRMKETSDYEMPEEFINAVQENPALKKAFEALTPGRQRGYLLYFSGAKQSETRRKRVEKHTQDILDGKGINDRK